MNAEYTTVLEVSSPNQDTEKPKIPARFVKCADWPPNKEAAEANERTYDALAPLRNTELASIPQRFRPLSSNGSQQSVCTMGMLICSLLRTPLNLTRRQRAHRVDAVLLIGDNIRGNQDYNDGCFFSLEALEAEIKSDDEIVAVVPMPGWLLNTGVAETHARDAVPGCVQYDEGVREEFNSEGKPVITHVAGEPLDLARIYRVATTISDLTNGQSPRWTEYYSKHPLLPPKVLALTSSPSL
jgi:hypothetical protein